MNESVTNPLFERAERAWRRTRKIRETHITLAHGSGGRAMHDLVEGLFQEYFKNPLLEKLEDQAVFEIPGLDPLYVANEGKLIAIVSHDIANLIVARMKKTLMSAVLASSAKSKPNQKKLSA